MSKKSRVAMVCIILLVAVVAGLVSSSLLEVLEGVGESLRLLWHWLLALPL